jgi:hypothetical protein
MNLLTVTLRSGPYGFMRPSLRGGILHGMSVMNYRQSLFTVILGLSLLVHNGCPALFVSAAAGGAAGAGTVAYIGGELKSTERVSLNRAWKATQTAIADLELIMTEKAKDAFDAELKATGAGGKKIKVALKRISDSTTEIRIRVGTFGDEPLSLQILESIRNRF